MKTKYVFVVTGWTLSQVEQVWGSNRNPKYLHPEITVGLEVIFLICVNEHLSTFHPVTRPRDVSCLSLLRRIFALKIELENISLFSDTAMLVILTGERGQF